jgi:hypothetical protein
MALKEQPVLKDAAQLNWTQEELRAFAKAQDEQKPQEPNARLMRAISRALQTFDR